jgi:hypothetical protein
MPDPLAGVLAQREDETELRRHLRARVDALRERQLDEGAGSTLGGTRRTHRRGHGASVDGGVDHHQRRPVRSRGRLVRPGAEHELADLQVRREHDGLPSRHRRKVAGHIHAQVDDRALGPWLRPRVGPRAGATGSGASREES